MDKLRMRVAAELIMGDFAVGEVRVGKRTVRGFVSDALPHTLPDFYSQWLGVFRDRTFIVHGATRLTFGQFGDNVAALAAQLRHGLGIQVGDRVAVCMRNSPEWAVAFAAATAMGAIAVPLNSWWKASELEYGLMDSGARVLFCDKERYAHAKAAIAKLGLVVVLCRCGDDAAAAAADVSGAGTGVMLQYDELVRAGAARPEGRTLPIPHILTPDNPALIMYTSGTTGHPKGVVLSHRGVTEQMNMAHLAIELRTRITKLAMEGKTAPPAPSAPAAPLQACMVCPIPLFHVTGSHHIFLASLVEGRKMVIMPKWSVTHALQLIQDEKVTSWTGVPTMVQDLMQHPDFAKYDTSSLTNVGGGGAPTPPSQIPLVAKKFRNGRAQQGYGLTETNGAVAIIAADDYDAHPRSTGKVFPIVEARLSDPDTGAIVESSATARGELEIKSSLVMLGYWNKPEATREVLDSEGWFKTGDIATIDDEGFVSIVDRAKDIVIRGGENISCSEVEAAVYQHPAVMEAAAFGVPHERLGEEVGLMVYVKPGMTVSAQEIVECVKPILANFKIPPVANIVFSKTELPRGPTGKMLKRVMRQLFAEIRSGGKKSKL